ncbi:MAG: SpoIIE family protein phosphatase [Butyrivibrio sp.]|nr:SpoIIE family protein phosphatase [Butyrivibrio sp.]
MKKLRQSITLKSVLGLTALLVFFAVIVCAIGYSIVTRGFLNLYGESVFKCANTATYFIDADRIDDYIDCKGESEECQKIIDMMDMLCHTQDVTFVYMIVPDLPDYKHITFLFSAMNKKYDYEHYDFGYYKETTNEEYVAKYKAMYESGSSGELVIRRGKNISTGDHITAMVPVIGADGSTKAILCVQKQMEYLSEFQRRYIGNILIIFNVFLVFVIIFHTFFLNRNILNPVKRITKEASRFANENITPGKKLSDSIKSEDQIGKLALSIDKMEQQIIEYVQDITKVTAVNERISTELELAEGIQTHMLPTDYPAFPDRKEFDIYASMKPAKEIGGDFYNYFFIDEDHLCIAIADASGKGIPAALFTMASKIIVDNNALSGLKAGEILNRVNNVICANNKDEMFISIWLGILEVSTGKLQAANAGHEYPAIMGEDGHFEILKDNHGMLIGIDSEMDYKTYEIDMKKNRKVFIYTDGVPEATDSKENMFGLEKMVDTLNSCDGSPKQIIDNMKKEIDIFAGEAEQFDDITMLCIQYLEL